MFKVPSFLPPKSKDSVVCALSKKMACVVATSNRSKLPVVCSRKPGMAVVNGKSKSSNDPSAPVVKLPKSGNAVVPKKSRKIILVLIKEKNVQIFEKMMDTIRGRSPGYNYQKRGQYFLFMRKFLFFHNDPLLIVKN